MNMVVDFLLLMGTNTLSGFPPNLKRTVAAAALGGAYGGIGLLPGFSFLGGVLWRCVFLALMGVIAFGCNRGSLKRTGIFLLLSLAMGGMAIRLRKRVFFTIKGSSIIIRNTPYISCTYYNTCLASQETSVII